MAEEASDAPAPLVLHAGEDSVTVDPADGARLTSLVAGGAERLLDTAGSHDPRMGWGAFLMAPWAGRLENATVPWEGQHHRIPATHGRHAIHGVTLDARWELEERGDRSVVLYCDLEDGGWPLGGGVELRINLSEGALALTTSIVAGPSGMPAGAGWHPWFRRPANGDVAVTVLASETLRTDAELIPDGMRCPVDTDTDLRGGPLLGERRLDHAYVDVDGPVEVRWPDLVLRMDIDAAPRTYVVHTPEYAFCVEPQSVWPNAPGLSAAGLAETGLAPLGPGAACVVRSEWRWERR